MNDSRFLNLKESKFSKAVVVLLVQQFGHIFETVAFYVI